MPQNMGHGATERVRILEPAMYNKIGMVPNDGNPLNPTNEEQRVWQQLSNTNKTNGRFTDGNLYVIPIIIPGHYIGVVIDVRARTITWYDSLIGNIPHFETHRKRFLQFFQQGTRTLL